jgi:hypothetical protein
VNPLEAAIFDLLSADGTLTGLAPGGVWRGVAPEGAQGIVVVFSHAGGPDFYTHTQRAFSDVQYLIKAIGPGLSAIDTGAAYERVDALINDAALPLSSGRVMACRRASTISMDETEGGEVWHHVGGIYSIFVQGA